MHALIGQSPFFLAAVARAKQAAKSEAKVLVTGETGTGKETLARLVHAESARDHKPFIAINCASLSPELLESELFGHVKGAFTSALRTHGGLVAAAAGGTLFLDEIGEMPAGLQAELLRFAETGEYRKVGSAIAEKADIRIISATHQDLQASVKSKLFREDLYYRLAVITIALPALRARREDIPALALALLRQISAAEGRRFDSIAEEAMTALQRYDWAGNIRELHNVLYSAIALHEGPVLTEAMLALPAAAPAALQILRENAKPQPLWRVEQAAIDAAIEYCGGNIPRAARLLEVSPSTLYRRRETMSESQTADF